MRLTDFPQGFSPIRFPEWGLPRHRQPHSHWTLDVTTHYSTKPFPLIPSAEVERVMARLATVDLTAPLSPSEQAAFNARRAAEMAKAEERRGDSPQLGLGV